MLTTISSSWDDSSWSIFWLPLNWQTWTRYHSDLKYHIFPTPALSLLKLFCCELEGKDNLMWRIQFTENLVDIMYKLNTLTLRGLHYLILNSPKNVISEKSLDQENRWDKWCWFLPVSVFLLFWGKTECISKFVFFLIF